MSISKAALRHPATDNTLARKATERNPAKKEWGGNYFGCEPVSVTTIGRSSLDSSGAFERVSGILGPSIRQFDKEEPLGLRTRHNRSPGESTSRAGAIRAALKAPSDLMPAIALRALPSGSTKFVNGYEDNTDNGARSLGLARSEMTACIPALYVSGNSTTRIL